LYTVQVTDHYQEAPLEESIQEPGLGFTDNHIEVSISPARGYPPIKLLATEYVSAREDALLRPYIQMSPSGEQRAKFATCLASPLRLTKAAINNVQRQWEESIEGAINGERYIGELKWGDASQVAWDLYHAVKQYSKSASVSTFV
jgi:hypothetical protein